MCAKVQKIDVLGLITGDRMRRRVAYKIFVYFLCLSFFLLTGGFPRMAAQAKGRSISIGEMVSSGEVKFEARKNAWKKVEPALFPVFQGVKIKTEKGEALIVLANNIRVQVGQDSLFSFQEANQLHLLKPLAQSPFIPTVR
jgi:hypothetical protein